ncbi:YesL family protein [Bacillus suaedae]|uniref:YesL family protein n=1 Tax=Halalkalibacter suaedae TaxID=2822140 RepID=A0A941AQZ4_9BACI|nr:YesL family protein [Bacillus suaedae]MBP3953351.1 YesL family protein [Bacillus suaedae]
MQMNGTMGGIYKVCEWLMRLAYLNLIWLGFSIIGLFILGLFPATIAMFVIVRKMLMGDDDIPIFKTFWASFKKEFIKSNLLGLTFLLVGYILYVNIQFLGSTAGLFSLLYYPTLLLGLGIILTSLYVFPVYVHYDISLPQIIKHSILIMLMNPISTVLKVMGAFAVYLLMTSIPGLIPLFSGSALALVIMWASFLAFTRIERSHQSAA